jgi:putative membrane protein
MEKRMDSKTIVLAGWLALASLPAFGQAQTDTLTPTIPASQIEALQLASTYEFLSTATGIDEFQTKAAALAENAAQSAEVKAFAQKMAAEHLKLVAAATKAGEADQTDIAAAHIDGQGQNLLIKMEVLEGAEFDRAYAEAQVFMHQFAIATYKGFAGKDNNLGRFAAATLPTIEQHYAEAMALAQSLGMGGAEQTQAPASGGEQTEAEAEDSAQ